MSYVLVFIFILPFCLRLIQSLLFFCQGLQWCQLRKGQFCYQGSTLHSTCPSSPWCWSSSGQKGIAVLCSCCQESTPAPWDRQVWWWHPPLFNRWGKVCRHWQGRNVCVSVPELVLYVISKAGSDPQSTRWHGQNHWASSFHPEMLLIQDCSRNIFLLGIYFQ